MLKGATRREFDMIAAWSVDRLGRSLQHLVAFLGEVHAAGVDLYLHQQSVDTSTPAGKAMFQMLGIFAEFERAMIVSRVDAGLKRARANGATLGWPKIDAGTEAGIRTALAKGDKGILKIAAEFGGWLGYGAADQGGGLASFGGKGEMDEAFVHVQA
jgi:DNA invertase Pin-like site-specific DNA recombinase